MAHHFEHDLIVVKRVAYWLRFKVTGFQGCIAKRGQLSRLWDSYPEPVVRVDNRLSIAGALHTG